MALICEGSRKPVVFVIDESASGDERKPVMTGFDAEATFCPEEDSGDCWLCKDFTCEGRIPADIFFDAFTSVNGQATPLFPCAEAESVNDRPVSAALFPSLFSCTTGLLEIFRVALSSVRHLGGSDAGLCLP
jgi:hypothetical protein